MTANPLEGAAWVELRALGAEWAAVVDEAQAAAAELSAAAAEAAAPAGGWSAAQCYEHLNLTLDVYLRQMEPALAAAARPARRGPRLDLWGRVLCWALEPGRGMKSKTTAPFQPGAQGGWPEAVSRFLELHERLGRLLAQSVDLDLESVKLASPFAARIRYHAYSAFRLILVHDRRHQAQARRAAAGK